MRKRKLVTRAGWCGYGIPMSGKVTSGESVWYIPNNPNWTGKCDFPVGSKYINEHFPEGLSLIVSSVDSFKSCSSCSGYYNKKAISLCISTKCGTYNRKDGHLVHWVDSKRHERLVDSTDTPEYGSDGSSFHHAHSDLTMKVKSGLEPLDEFRITG